MTETNPATLDEVEARLEALSDEELRALAQKEGVLPKPKRGRPSQKQEWAELVFDAIETDVWKNSATIEAETGLTRAQVAAAVVVLRDNYPDLPLVSTPEGYCWTIDANEVRKYHNRRIRSAFTIINRNYKGVMGPWLKAVKHPEAARIERQFTRLLEDLGDVLRVAG